MIAVLKHEMKNHFHSLTAYVFGAFLLVFVGIGSMIYNIQGAMANFEYALASISLVFVLIIPILTMRTIAEEKKQKTDQLLYSLPITTTQVVLGKFLSLIVVFAIPMCIIALYPLIFAGYGEVYLPTSYGALFAFFVLGAVFISIGIFISSLTENQGFAAGIAVPVLLFDYYSVTLSEHVSSTAMGSLAVICVLAVLAGIVINHLTKNYWLAYGVGAVGIMGSVILYRLDSAKFENLLPEIMKKMSLYERFYSFVNGVFDMTAIVYYGTVIIFFLFLSVQSLEKRRYN
ncbi:MAG: ABC transporter permease [Lachnospiraceae bacterium]|nr:ABC transporter permease [Muribaculaceae bacterium]MCM1411883.1 ABC transporter permease [Lachnospiraceae bacterium]